ncbi:MAG: hypothetical protein H7145_14230 [Akkermansiaceae bacterium]|nr:hypothetical protein [Armatimonadota bacterium]
MDVNTEGIEAPFFRAAITSHVAEYVRHFGRRLVAVYVWGSVHRGEAVPGVSDLDLHAFIRDQLSPADEEWFQKERHPLEARFPGTLGLSRPLPLEMLRAGLRDEATVPARNLSRSLAFRLRHDGMLLWGEDLLPEPKLLPAFDKEFGTGGFESQRDLARWAAGWTPDNETDFALPDSPRLRLRKLARLAVLGGGWYLIATGRLLSLRGSDVLPVLRREFPDRTGFLEQTKQLYIAPVDDVSASSQLAPYTREVARWTDMLGERLGMGPTIEPRAGP